MRPWNFPARKLARKIAANTRNMNDFQLARIVCVNANDYLGMDAARATRTKIDRSSKGMFGI